MNARWIAILAGFLAACGADDDGRGQGGGSGIASVGGGESTGTAGEEGPGSGVLDLPPDPGESGFADTGMDECASYSETAMNEKLPADIIVVVDNSGSMDFEAAAVQDNLNSFSSQIIMSGVDVHVALVSSYPGTGNGMCIEPPLGSGGCDAMDNNPPLFTHVNQEVDSHDALQQVLGHYPEWAPMIRAGAGLHIVVVSDDESDLDAVSFDNQFKALDPDFVDYKLHGIVCTTNCEETASIGDAYIALGQLTGGIISDLCDQDFQPVFDLLATEVIAGAVISCEWDVPEPPDGMELNPDEVNVEFDDGMGNGFVIGRVDGPADCPNVVDGWYYDNPAMPTKILACPQTCTKIQGFEQAQIEITLGCATVPAG